MRPHLECCVQVWGPNTGENPETNPLKDMEGEEAHIEDQQEENSESASLLFVASLCVEPSGQEANDEHVAQSHRQQGQEEGKHSQSPVYQRLVSESLAATRPARDLVHWGLKQALGSQAGTGVTSAFLTLDREEKRAKREAKRSEEKRREEKRREEKRRRREEKKKRREEKRREEKRREEKEKRKREKRREEKRDVFRPILRHGD
ncbi:hypothetical protein DUI87_16265 [Hirundo rustica rustica]|uniref:Uncharacterized protein n=1 Tax=Hirundo rustica rustica TaxID=333673 RepID=A0A3M0K1F6_HIRRU|nr:hypothetical protein DUI87_16265 [Hirundo rustica rustica]